MKIIKSRLSFLFVMTVFQIACLESPLINHVDADETLVKSTVPTQSEVDAEKATPSVSEPAISSNEGTQRTGNEIVSSPRPLELDCQFVFQKANVCGQFRWIQQQTEEEMGVFEVRFLNRETGELAALPFPLSVRLWMPSMGHGSSPVRVEQLEAGKYQVSRVYFSMPGDWEIQFLLKNGTQVFDSSKIQLDI